MWGKGILGSFTTEKKGYLEEDFSPVEKILRAFEKKKFSLKSLASAQKSCPVIECKAVKKGPKTLSLKKSPKKIYNSAKVRILP